MQNEGKTRLIDMKAENYNKPPSEKSYHVGWIHTHPSMDKFLTSVDLHTEYECHELFAPFFSIVATDKDHKYTYQAFRIKPEYYALLKKCKGKGFHDHPGHSHLGGQRLYEICKAVTFVDDPQKSYTIMNFFTPNSLSDPKKSVYKPDPKIAIEDTNSLNEDVIKTPNRDDFTPL